MASSFPLLQIKYKTDVTKTAINIQELSVAVGYQR